MPQNTVCEMKTDVPVTFFCQTDITPRTDAVLNWAFTPENVSKEIEVFNTRSIVYKDETYSVVSVSANKSVTLVVKTSSSSVAGRYYCRDEGGTGQSACADLILLKEDPVCKQEPSSKDKMCCSISYAGNISPFVELVKNDTSIKEKCMTSHSSGIVKCCLVAEARSTNYICKISTPETSHCETNWIGDYSKSYNCEWSKTGNIFVIHKICKQITI